MKNINNIKIFAKFTNPTSNLTRYFSDITKYEPLNSKEEAELAVKAKNGDEIAKEKIIKSNLRFVISVAKVYSTNGILLEELIAEGNKGLVEAIEKFDPTTGFKFISYAVWYIKKNIFLYLTNQHKSIRLPVNVVNDIKKYQKIVDYLTSEYHREPTSHEVLELLNDKGFKLISDNAINVIKNTPTVVPLEVENTGEDDNKFSPISWLSSNDTTDEILMFNDDKRVFYKSLRQLPEDEKKVLELKYGLLTDGNELTYKEIGEMFGKNPEWARIQANKGQSRLRNIFRKLNIKSPDISFSK